MKLGMGAAALLALGGGAVALFEPGVHRGRLTAGGRMVFSRVGAAVLEGVLPADRAPREAALAGFLGRVEALISALPAHAQQQLSQLLAVLSTAVGRRALAGLCTDWRDASLAQVQAALDEMRKSPMALRTQAYQALHDISGAAYFSDRGTWAVLGYPGPAQP